MHAVEKQLMKAARKIAKWHPDKVGLQLLPTGFILKLHGDAEIVPTIGVVNDQLVGAQDDFDIFLDVIGYEAQVERVVLAGNRARFVLEAGWSSKLWKKPTADDLKNTDDFRVDVNAVQVASKVAAIALALISAVEQESSIWRRLSGLGKKLSRKPA